MTHKEIEALQSEKGGYTRRTLASLGVPWPPPRGWKRRLASDETRAAKQASLTTTQVNSMSSSRATMHLLRMLDLVDSDHEWVKIAKIELGISA